MTAVAIHFGLIIFVLAITVPFLGNYMARVFTGERHFGERLLGWLERSIYRICGISPMQEMDWKSYLKALLCFNFLGFALLFFIMLTQQWLPLNPQHLPAIEWTLALNTAISFVTNTNWQSYAGETTLSYFAQMVGLTTQNFLSAATGNAALLVLVRGFFRESKNTVGNFWADLVKMVLYILLPLSIILAVILVSQGVIQNYLPYVEVTTLENEKQILPMGPVASQEAIKQLGTNGGGFFNVNSAHPFENPTQLSNFFETVAILLIPAATLYMYGTLIRRKRASYVLLAVMSLLSIGGILVSTYGEQLPNKVLDVFPYMEGKEIRFSRSYSTIWSIFTTDTGNGSVNCMLSSLPAISGGMSMLNIMTGELIFGGVGVGLCSILMFIMLTVFLAGLMVGRTPEHLGKKIEKREIQLVMLSVLLPAALTLFFAGACILIPVALKSLGNQGPHGLSELLYTGASTAGNNGSAFAGLDANTQFYNLALGFVMLVGRLSIIVPSIVIGGYLVEKKRFPISSGTFATDTWLFGILFIGIIFIVSALTFFPALCLGPIMEQIAAMNGQAF